MRIIKKFLPKTLRGRVAATVLPLPFILCAVLWLAVPDPLSRVLFWPVSPVLLDKNGDMINARLSADGEWCLPVPLEDMGRWLPQVLVAVEDKRFYGHSGVDCLALARAVVQNAAARRVVSGASTITSQLVRLSTPRERTFGAKILEFVGALKLERSLGKDEILEYYLNRAPFGGPIRGAEAAARLYFGKRARELSLGEAALLVGLLKGPTAYRPDKNPKAALARRQQIIARVAERTGFARDLTALALQEPLPAFRPVMPGRARHFADLAFKTLPPEGGVVRSSLDPRLQSLLERVLDDRLRDAPADVTAAGIVVDNRTASIAAYVGNARFDPLEGREWVDCALAARSPGSTLKPFVYLAAMEQGQIIPATLLADTPLNLGGQAPRNFDRRYRGPVPAATALADSLNAPAVRVQRMIGVRSSLARLRAAGFSHLDRDDAEYGDSLVLGAGEVTLLELARAYTALASLGLDRPLLLSGPARKENALGDSVPQAPRQGSDSPAPPIPGNPREARITGERGGLGGIIPHSRGLGRHPQIDFPFAQAMPPGLAPVAEQLAHGWEGAPQAARQLHSGAAAFLTAEILRDTTRLPFIAQVTQARESAPLAFKTGTSYGLRDAWTVAYNPAFTVAVWFGKAGGGADAGLTGIGMAAPAALKVLRAAGGSHGSGGGAPGVTVEEGWYGAPASVGWTRVCGLSGMAPSPWCPSTRDARYIPSAWRTVACPMHVLRDGKVLLVWTPELEDYHRKRFAEDDLSRQALITSPLAGSRYMITPGARAQPLPLRAEGVTYPVHWYVEGEYLGVQERADLPLYWQPVDGKHTVSLLDALERTAAAVVEVADLARREEDPVPLLGQWAWR